MNEENTIKIERKADGTVSRAKEAKRRGRPAGTGNPTYKLVCSVTGATRATNQNYLNAKAARLKVSVEDVVNNYVSKAGLKQIMEDEKFDETCKALLVRLNGGTRQRTKKAAPVELKKAAK